MKSSVILSPLRLTSFRTDQEAFRSRPGNFLIRLNVKRTSAAVSGFPSLHWTPGRIVNVSVLFPLLHA